MQTGLKTAIALHFRFLLFRENVDVAISLIFSNLMFENPV